MENKSKAEVIDVLKNAGRLRKYIGGDIGQCNNKFMIIQISLSAYGEPYVQIAQDIEELAEVFGTHCQISPRDSSEYPFELHFKAEGLRIMQLLTQEEYDRLSEKMAG